MERSAACAHDTSTGSIHGGAVALECRSLTPARRDKRMLAACWDTLMRITVNIVKGKEQVRGRQIRQEVPQVLLQRFLRDHRCHGPRLIGLLTPTGLTSLKRPVVATTCDNTVCPRDPDCVEACPTCNRLKDGSNRRWKAVMSLTPQSLAT